MRGPGTPRQGLHTSAGLHRAWQHAIQISADMAGGDYTRTGQGRAIGLCIKWEKETISENVPTIVSGTENFEIKTVQGGDSWAWPKSHTERKNSFE